MDVKLSDNIFNIEMKCVQGVDGETIYAPKGESPFKYSALILNKKR